MFFGDNHRVCEPFFSEVRSALRLQGLTSCAVVVAHFTRPAAPHVVPLLFLHELNRHLEQLKLNFVFSRHSSLLRFFS